MSVEKPAVENILTLARASAKARKTTVSAISRIAHGDSRALGQLADGSGSITLRKYESAMTWLRDPMNWPDGHKIPSEPWRMVRRKNGE